jgi:purine-binding chemotaxis protein CheW
VAEEILLEDEDTMKGKYLTFSLDEEFYGVEISYVTEIVGIQPITEMPDLPKCIKGIINLRGDIIPVLDARLRFNKLEKEYNDRTCVIVVELEKIQLGIIVDVVSEVINIEDENIVPPPQIGSMGRKFIKNVGKYNNLVLLIIDVEQLLDEDELRDLMNTQ